MSIERELNAADRNVNFVVQQKPKSISSFTNQKKADESIMACNTCIDQIENPDNIDLNH
jgi:protein PhnA